MYAAPGIGLAATQVNHHIRLVVIDLSEDNPSRVYLSILKLKPSLMKPIFIKKAASRCGFYEDVQRPQKGQNPCP